MEQQIKVIGMSCMHCVGAVKKALEAVEGVESVDVSLEQSNAAVIGNAPMEKLISAVTEAGYQAESQ